MVKLTIANKRTGTAFLILQRNQNARKEAANKNNRHDYEWLKCKETQKEIYKDNPECQVIKGIDSKT